MGFLKRLWKANSATESNISRALRAVVERDTPTARRNLHNALRQQRLILPVPKLPDNLERDASGRLQQNVRSDFLSIQDRHGRKSLAVFTNPGALKKWTPPVASTWIAVDTRSICRMGLGSDYSAVQINPGNHDFVELSIEEMRLLAQAEAGHQLT
jgi:hypothetical protein